MATFLQVFLQQILRMNSALGSRPHPVCYTSRIYSEACSLRRVSPDFLPVSLWRPFLFSRLLTVQLLQSHTSKTTQPSCPCVCPTSLSSTISGSSTLLQIESIQSFFPLPSRPISFNLNVCILKYQFKSIFLPNMSLYSKPTCTH